jgi:lipopolysaccharide export system protein LptA
MSKALMYKVTKNAQHRVSLRISLIGPAILIGAILMVLASPSVLSVASNTTSANKAAVIKIKADYMAFDLETGRNLYEGNVSIVQGNIELTGDKVTILRSNNKVSDIEVTGNPARYLQDENTENIVRAVSQQIHYSAQNNRLVLTDEASLKQSNHTVESQRIVYDTAKKMIIAGKTPAEKGVEKDAEKSASKQRVNITLTPKKDNQKDPQEK